MPEDGRITSARDLHDDRLVQAFGIEISLDAFPQFRSVHPNNRIDIGVVISWPVRDRGTNLIFMDLVAAILQRTPAHIKQETPEASARRNGVLDAIRSTRAQQIPESGVSIVDCGGDASIAIRFYHHAPIPASSNSKKIGLVCLRATMPSGKTSYGLHARNGFILARQRRCNSDTNRMEDAYLILLQ